MDMESLTAGHQFWLKSVGFGTGWAELLIFPAGFGRQALGACQLPKTGVCGGATSSVQGTWTWHVTSLDFFWTGKHDELTRHDGGQFASICGISCIFSEGWCQERQRLLTCSQHVSVRESGTNLQMLGLTGDLSCWCIPNLGTPQTLQNGLVGSTVLV